MTQADGNGPRGAPRLRVAPGPEGVSIWSVELFAGPALEDLRSFLARSFSVGEVEGVEIRRSAGYGRLSYRRADDPTSVWRRLAKALRGGSDRKVASSSDGATGTPGGAEYLYLDHPASWPLRVHRVGGALSTWSVRPAGRGLWRVSHPILQVREGAGFQLEQRIGSLLGVEAARARRLSSDVLVRIDTRILSLEGFARELEKSWPVVLERTDEPPSSRRLFAAGTLLTLAAAGQFAVPALRPVAVGAVVVYSAPNVAAAARQLRRGVVGLPALYSFGLGLMLLSGLPLTGTIMASLMQLWPYLTHRTIVNRQRRLFEGHRRRAVWARVAGSAAEVETHVDDLRPGDEVVVRAGEIVPVDGVVTAGLATLVEGAARDPAGLQDVGPGDGALAGAVIRDGEVTIRVERSGDATAASHLAAALPYSVFQTLPSLVEAERVANRNARPALALAALNLVTTRSPRFSQAVIRPDYLTAPRLSVQLTALHDIADGLRRGLLIRRPGALDVLPDIDVVALDDGAELNRRRLEVSRVASMKGAADDAIAYAAAALGAAATERARALAALAARRPAAAPARAHGLRRRPGAWLFRDDEGRRVAVASRAFLAANGLTPPDLGEAAAQGVYVLREGAVLGAIGFRRLGEPEALSAIAALRRRNPRLRFVHLSGGAIADAEETADRIGLDAALGGLSPRDKAEALRSVGRRVIWVGDATSRDAEPALGASAVSVSTSGFARTPDDRADVLLLRGGLSGLDALWALADAHRERLAGDYRAVYAANLVGVAGAFLANFGSLQSGLLSNLGSGVVYARHVAHLNGLIAVIEAERSRLG